MKIEDELAEIALAMRDLAVRVEALQARFDDESDLVFDPTDEPPVRPDFDGDRTQKDWGALLLWGRLLAINVRENRGATRDEVVQIAKDAGYRDGRGWNKWAGWVQRENGRWITADARVHLDTYAERVGRTLPADLAKALDGLDQLII